MNINYFGAVRMLELGKACKNLLTYCHVSTTYVNCNLPKGSICEEEIYNKEQPVERLVQQIMKMNPLQIQENLKSIIGDYPNTYTFTKSLFEKTLMKTRGSMKTVIFRPSMIGATYREPVKGWVDNISALGAPLFFGGLGIYNYVVGTRSNVDPCAVDMCINHILVAVAHRANSTEPDLHIYNHSSTHANPCDTDNFRKGINKFYEYYPLDKQIAKPGISFATPAQRTFRHKARHMWPLVVPEFINSLPIIGSKANIDKINKLKKMQTLVYDTSDKNEFFELGNWKFAN